MTVRYFVFRKCILINSDIELLQIVLIGSGNVAHAFARAIGETTHEVLAVFARNPYTVYNDFHPDLKLVTNNWGQIPSDADIYILAVSDNAIAACCENLARVNGVVVHCSGTTSMNLLSSENKGVIWPLQSISQSTINFKQVPLCIEANTDVNLRIIENFCDSLSQVVRVMSEQQRKYLHLAAVFANNFGNHMLAQAKNICNEQGLDFDLLKPMMLHMIEQAFLMHPAALQTGPARRDDSKTLEAHRQLLQNNAELLSLYNTISSSIFELSKKKHD